MASCIRLRPFNVLPGLETLLQPIVSAFFLPGGHVLHRPLCTAIEVLARNFTQEAAPLLTLAVLSLLSNPQARGLFEFRGGDGDPDTMLGLLSVATCLVREAREWTVLITPEQQAPVLKCVELTLQLAARNTPCNHRDVSLRAVSALSAVLALALDVSAPLHPALLIIMRDQDSMATQGLLVTLFSLNSAAILPKIVRLMADIALLAVACSEAQLDTPVDVVSAAAGQVLQRWLAAARQDLNSAGVLRAEITDALIAQLNWVSVLHHAALQHFGDFGARSEVRKSTQRAVRQLVDAVQRSGAALP